MSTIRHWIWMSTRGKHPPQYAARILALFGSPEGAYHADRAACAQAEALPETVRASLMDKDLSGADRILETCRAQGIRILTIQDAAYPERLRQIPDPPCVLYVKGDLPTVDEEAAVAVVGARKASPYGVMTARTLGLDLARQGALVVSGSARGIDQAAIEGALKGGGQVLCVLGNGIDVIYPKGSAALYQDVAAQGALLSEYPPGTEPKGSHFPLRNRLLAGLSLGVVVVEGTATSGSLITARWALEEDRDVFAVPGNIDAPLSRGPNGLIARNEAKLIQDAWDILEEYEFLYPAKVHPKGELPLAVREARLGAPAGEWPEDLPKPAPKAKAKSRPQPEDPPEEETLLTVDLREDPEAFTDDELALLRALQTRRYINADDLAELTGIPARRVMSALTMLQVRALVRQEIGAGYEALVRLKE